MKVERIGVIGAGQMGSGIAQVFAQSGFQVLLVDVAQPILDRAHGTNLERRAAFLAELLDPAKMENLET